MIGEGQHDALQYGLMNAFKTGNMVLDVLICMIVPLLLNTALSRMQDSKAWVKKLFHLVWSNHEEVIRTIEYTKRMNQWGHINNGEQTNHILQKAITCYMARGQQKGNKEVFKPEYALGRVELLDSEHNAGEECYDSDYEEEQVNAHDQLEQMKVGTLPALNEWVEIESGLWFQHSIDDPNGDEGQNRGGGGSGSGFTKLQESVIEFSLKVKDTSMTKAHRIAKIDDFINRAYSHYKDDIRKKIESDTSRYMYMLWKTHDEASNGGDEGDRGSSDRTLYKKYKLAEEKSFQSLFFPDKRSLLDLLEKFTHKQGKFGIEGFPHKLGLLLHGPPGTGKTSLIKAIAKYTGRHIVSISLTKIKTNQELMDCMFDKVFQLPNEDVPNKLKFDQIVFVMEDIDCASAIVNARKCAKELEDEPALTDTSLSESSIDSGAKTAGPVLSKVSTVKDKLNLAGLLNVLDGVVDSPNRVVIMTTNHPEKLDPALIRPGRINKQIMLGYMQFEHIVEMIEHFFQTTMSPHQKQVLQNQICGGIYTPAEIEQLCAEYDDVDSLICNI